MTWIAGIRGLLLDVDGTLISGERAIAGAADALSRLNAAGVPYRLTTNTTRHSRAKVAEILCEAGIEADGRDVLAPSVLARRRILDSGRRRAALLVAEGSKIDFDGVEEVDAEPDWVVLGDLGERFSWGLLNRAFRWLFDGAGLIALQKNRYWHAGERGLVLDAGAFVAGLEFAAGVTAELVGKPSAGFFELALGALGLPAESVLVVGDDADNDCGGALAAGCRAALVRTGKFDEARFASSGIAPDLVLDSIAELDPQSGSS